MVCVETSRTRVAALVLSLFDSSTARQIGKYQPITVYSKNVEWARKGDIEEI